jgi:hypothetical protein
MEKIEITNGVFPARLTAEQTATLLGFQIHDIPVLVAENKLKPLGKPAQNASKHFSLARVTELARDEVWLNKATQCLYDYWRTKNGKKNKRREQSTAESEGSLAEMQISHSE